MKCSCKYFCYLNLKYVFAAVIKLGADMRYSWTTARFVFKRELTTFSQISNMTEIRFQKPYFAGLRLDKLSLRRLLLSLNL